MKAASQFSQELDQIRDRYLKFVRWRNLSWLDSVTAACLSLCILFLLLAGSLFLCLTVVEIPVLVIY